MTERWIGFEDKAKEWLSARGLSPRRRVNQDDFDRSDMESLSALLAEVAAREAARAAQNERVGAIQRVTAVMLSFVEEFNGPSLLEVASVLEQVMPRVLDALVYPDRIEWSSDTEEARK